MGMSASQARLLSITARMSDNENSAQGISYAKQRLSDETQQLNNEYNESLNATKLTVITGYNNGEAIYTDISYNLLTDTQMLSGKQYVVTDNKGKLIVDSKIAKAYELGNGDFNVFLAEMGYSQADLLYDIKYDSNTFEKDSKQQEVAQQVHEAWDKYFASVGINVGDEEHDNGAKICFGYTTLTDGNYPAGFPAYAKGDGNGHFVDENGAVTEDPSKFVYEPINYEGTTKEQREYYDYATALTASFISGGTYKNAKGQTVNLKDASDANNKSIIAYYENLFNRMQQGDYMAYTTTLEDTKGENGRHYEYVEDLTKSIMKDNSLFEGKLKKGEILLESFSTTANQFVSASLGSDQTIVEVEDERAIARAEREYEQNLTALENKDKKFDLELNKLDTEHNALQTEYDSVKNVIDKNVEKTFNIFS